MFTKLAHALTQRPTASVAFALLTLFLFATTAMITANAIPSLQEPDVLANIHLKATITETDRLQLQTSLRWLRAYSPEWYAYIESAKPLVVSVDEDLGQDDILSDSWCCDGRGAAEIRFGTHFDHWPSTDAAKIDAQEALQFEILSTFIHEATHIRDMRAGQIGAKTNTEACIAAESAAYSKQVEFARALTTIHPTGDALALEQNRRVTEKESEIANANFEGIGWRVACF